ncbi:MAG: hypothetical protein IT363_10415 [Methanoregulaceae archaeon]|nr:hypothetical protein [Methanoregulaceae archaeon]
MRRDTLRWQRGVRGELAFEEVETLSHSTRVDDRCLALMALRDYSALDAEVITRRLLRDRSFRVRLDAAATVGCSKIFSLAEKVYELAVADPHIRVRLWSVQALRYLRDPRWLELMPRIEGPGLNSYEQADRGKLQRMLRIFPLEKP